MGENSATAAPAGAAAPVRSRAAVRAWPLVAVFLAVIAAVAAIGVLWYRRQEAAVWRDAGESVSAVADLKLQQLVQWRRERLADAQVIRQSPNTVRGLEVFVRGDRGSVNVARLREWLSTLAGRGYAHASIVDAEGRVLVEYGFTGHTDDPATRAAVAEALRTGEISFGSLHRVGGTGPIRLDLVAPLLPQAEKLKVRRPFAAVVLQIDPAQFLFPLLSSWPTPSRTAEVLLVRRDSADALYLNELRHRSGTALSLRLPLADTGLAGALAASGRKGLVEARDYRGARVLAALRLVPDTRWALVAKVDADEVREPLRSRTRSLALLLVGLLVAGSVVVWALWRQRALHHYRELYEAEVRRRALTQHYESLTRYANDIILLADRTGRIVDANERAVEVYGYDRDALLALNIADLRESGSPDEVAYTMREVAERGGAVYELTHRRRDGTTFPIEASTRIIQIDGQPYYQGIIRDISERRRHERRIADLNRLYAVLSQINEAIVRQHDRDALLREACRVAVEVGTFRLAWVGLVEGDAVRPVAWAGAAQGYLEQLRVTVRDEPLGRGPSGRAVREGRTVISGDIATDPAMAPWRDLALARGFRSNAALPLSLHDRVIGVFSLQAGDPQFFDAQERRLLDDVAADLSYALLGLEREEERRRAEEERSRLVAAIEQATEMVLVTDLTGAIQYANPAFERITGYDRQEAIGQNPRFLKSGRQDDDFYQGLWTTVLAGGVWQGRMTNRRKDGSLYEQQTTISPVRDAGGSVVDLVAVARDVTREVALESQLRQAQKMDELGRLAGGVAHDFNNLLTAIIGSAELVLAELPADAPALQDAQNIQRAARRGADLTQKLLAVSRRQRLATRAIALGEVVTDFARLVRRLLREDIELVVRADVPGPTVHGDPGAMDQILMNLVTNARDAISGSGTIAVDVTAVSLDQDDCDLLGAGIPGAWVLLAVSDTGSGMTEDVQQRLFEPFFTTKEAGAGTGLGMAVVFGLVQEHRGFVRVDSDPGTGTTVRVYFPASAEAATGTPYEASGRLPCGSETVLVVEDEEALRGFARRALEKHGYRVRTAANGLDALDVLRAEGAEVALVVSDMVMPRMGGPQLERAMREAGFRMPMLFTSGYAARTVDEQRLREGGVPFLAKPWTVADLLRRVREVLDTPRV
jgi:two-component system cell cycle sensor histidine kinase/response regulator CckA